MKNLDNSIWSVHDSHETLSEADTVSDAENEAPIEFPEDHKTDAENFLAALSHMRELMDNYEDPESESGEDSGSICMTAGDYHNKATHYARRGDHKSAADICIDGLLRFPYNIDLRADIIKYCSEIGDTETAAQQYAFLRNSVPFRCWNWRAFSFSLDHLLADSPIKNEEECRLLIDQYKAYLPYEEKACVAESELEAALGNAETSMQVLETAILAHANASQCAIRLADMQMERGLYTEVITTADYGIAASAEVQPSVNVPYLYYIRALAKDHILHKKECRQEPICSEDITALMDEYELMLHEFPELLQHAHTIRMRMKMLKFMKASA